MEHDISWRSGLKRRIYGLVQGAGLDGANTDAYDIAMMAVIALSMVPVMFKETNAWLNAIDWSTAGIFIVDYALRWWTADLHVKKGKASYALYPFTPMAIVDLLSILPVFTGANCSLKLLRLLRAARALRAFKLLRYSQSCLLIRNAVYSQRHALASAYAFALGYVFVSALLVFSVEPQTFETFLDALYWSVVSLTTVGYGDLYPVSAIGRCVTVLSAFVGIAIVALPAGIITAGYMTELAKTNEN
jgi:voltage-gated potassium channel